jgi:hypothetical protein
VAKVGRVGTPQERGGWRYDRCAAAAQPLAAKPLTTDWEWEWGVAGREEFYFPTWRTGARPVPISAGANGSVRYTRAKCKLDSQSVYRPALEDKGRLCLIYRLLSGLEESTGYPSRSLTLCGAHHAKAAVTIG